MYSGGMIGDKCMSLARHGGSYLLEAEAGGLAQVQGQPGLHSEFQFSLGYRIRPGLNKKETKSATIH